MLKCSNVQQNRLEELASYFIYNSSVFPNCLAERNLSLTLLPLVYFFEPNSVVEYRPGKKSISGSGQNFDKSKNFGMKMTAVT